MDKLPTVAVLYGFCEGPRISRAFERDLEAYGLIITSDVAKADIIIGHSGGCFLVPRHNRADLIVLIGLPYWPGKSTAKSLRQKVQADMREHHDSRNLKQWFAKTFWNCYYFWRMGRNIKMLRAQKRGQHWKLPGKKTVIIRNNEDPFCMPDTYKLPFIQKPTCYAVPGQHDNCWIDPTPYADIVQSEYAARILA